MTQPPSQPGQPRHQPPYQQPYGAPPPTPYQQPGKPRPRAVLFVVGGVLLVLAPLVFAGSLLWTLRPLTQSDGVVTADGTPQQVDLPAGEDRGLFLAGDDAGTTCTAVDSAGTNVEFGFPGGDFTTGDWRAVNRFHTGAGDLTLTCQSPDPSDQVRIGPLPSTGGLVGGLLVGILAPMVLGLLGLLVLIVTAVLWGTRPPRPKT